jgi:hypothetical protein
LTKFICSLVIGISLLFIPTPATAEDIIINLDATTAYVDVVVNVDTTTAYVITTTTGPRFEVVDSVTVERPAWVDSWLWLYRGVADSTTANSAAIAGDDDGNSSSNNYWASRLSGTLNADTYTIRATSYDYVVAGQRAVGTYTLSSGLIPHRDTATAVVDTATVIVDTPTVTVDTPTVPTSIPEPTSPVQPPLPETGPILIMPPFDLPQEIVVVEETIAEVIPTVDEPLEELPVVEIPPDIPEEIIEDVAQLPEDVAQLPLTIEEAVIDIIAEAEANGEAVTTEALEEAGLTLADLPPETPVQLDNGVVITAAVAVALELFDSPVELISAIFTSPEEVLTAITNIGADMSEEERAESEKTIVASVIAGQAAINAAGIAATAKAPVTSSTPSNDNIKLLRRRKP